jgi:hypothetical protein
MVQFRETFCAGGLAGQSVDEEVSMNRIASGMIAAVLLWGPAVGRAQQDKNPNQQQQQSNPQTQPPPGNAGQNTPSPSNPDIPKEKPGTNNPDISPDSKPAAPDTTPQGKNRRKKNRKRGSSSTDTGATHTAPTA